MKCLPISYFCLFSEQIKPCEIQNSFESEKLLTIDYFLSRILKVSQSEFGFRLAMKDWIKNLN